MHPHLTPSLTGPVAAKPVVVATGITVPSLQSVGKVGDVRVGSTLGVGQVAEVDSAGVVAASGLVNIALGVTSVRCFAVLADPLDIPRTLAGALSSIANHLENGGHHIIWVIGDRASICLHETTILDTIVGAWDADITGRLSGLVSVS